MFNSRLAAQENRLHVLEPFKKLRYSDGATTVAGAKRKYLGTIPAGSLLTNVYVRVVTGFNAAGNDYLTVGTSGDDDAYVDDFNLATAGMFSIADQAGTLLPVYISTDVDVYATYVYSSTAPTQGEAEVAIQYVAWKQEDSDL